MAKTISTLLNHAVGYNLSADNPLTITSTGGILASTGSYGLSLGGSGIIWSVLQEGTVSAAGSTGVTITTGSLTNTVGGLIEGAANGVVLGGAGTVTNAGTIAGGSYAVSFAAGAQGLVIVDPGAVFSGKVHGGNTVSGGTVASTLQFASGLAQGTFAGLGSHYSGFDTYLVTKNASWLVTGSNTLAAGDTMTIAGTVTSNSTFVNAGYITGGQYSPIAVQGGVFTNSGHVYNQNNVALDLVNASVTNLASGTIGGNVGVRVHNNAILNNYGTIKAQNEGVSAVGAGTVVNQHGASIVGGFFGAYALNGATLLNDGYLLGSGTFAYDAGVYVTNAAVIINEVGATIAGAFHGARLGAGSVINMGLVTGGVDGIHIGGGTMFNEGMLTGSVAGASLYSPGLSNYGFDIFGTISNAAGGTIQGGSFGVIGYGLVFNAGTILAGSSGYAVSFSSVGTLAGDLVFQTGGTIIGKIGGGSTSTLEFASDTGTLNGFGSTIVGFSTIKFDPNSKWTLAGAASAFGPSETITGIAVGGTVELQGIVESLQSVNNGLMTLSGGTTLNVPGVSILKVTNDGANTFITACFASGTEVTTARGQVAVEALRVGDRVITATGRLAPVTWIGHRRTDLRRHPSPHDVLPVRVKAGALAEKVPVRDLILSPDHAVLVGRHLVPIRHLVNGRSIVQESRESVTYWHVELDRHDLILAEDMACETYLDTGNRHAFEGEAAMQLHPAFGRDQALAVWQAQGCAPILTDPADPDLRALHLRLLVRSSRHVEALEAAISA